MRMRLGYGCLGRTLVLSTLLSCATTQERITPPTPDIASSTYPADMRAQGIESDVILSLIVLPDGSTSDIVVERSGGSEFDRAAVNAMRTVRFRPAMRAGVAVPFRIKFTYRFRLENGH